MITETDTLLEVMEDLALDERARNYLEAGLLYQNTVNVFVFTDRYAGSREWYCVHHMGQGHYAYFKI